MGDHATSNNFTSDATFAEKGKAKATDTAHEMSMDDDSSSESEPELQNEEDDEDTNLEPVDQANIIKGGRRTRGVKVNYAEIDDNMKDDDEEDEDDDYEGVDNDNDHEMRG